nr:nicotinamide riboside kinase 2-like [Cavia porcellus]
MYQKYKQEMEAAGVDVVQLDGTRPREELFLQVLGDIHQLLLAARLPGQAEGTQRGSSPGMPTRQRAASHGVASSP